MTLLTRREVDILLLVALGNGNRQIAKVLSISNGTVNNHIASILDKLAANNRAQAVYKAVSLGLIECKVEEP
jgi:DNA-binding NarL/FixJ family response regulator